MLQVFYPAAAAAAAAAAATTTTAEARTPETSTGSSVPGRRAAHQNLKENLIGRKFGRDQRVCNLEARFVRVRRSLCHAAPSVRHTPANQCSACRLVAADYCLRFGRGSSCTSPSRVKVIRQKSFKMKLSVCVDLADN